MKSMMACRSLQVGRLGHWADVSRLAVAVAKPLLRSTTGMGNEPVSVNRENYLVNQKTLDRVDKPY
jgi:hypothetical protein